MSGPSAIDAPAGTHRSDSGSALIAIGAAAADSARSNGIHGGAAAARPDASQANAPEAIAGAELDPTPDIPLLPAAVANATSVAQPQNEVAAAPRVPRRPAALAPTAGRGAVALVAPEPSQLWLTTHAELGLGDEGGVFWGAAVTVGTRLGAARPGLRIRGATGRRQPNPLQSNAARTGFELLASIDLPLEAGAFVIAPGVGAGAGWMRSVRLNEEAAICDSPFRGSSECSTTTPIVRDGFAPSTWAPRLEIYTSAMWQAKADWGLELVLSATYTPFAQSGELAPEYAVKLDPAERARMSLAGEPNVVFRGALGLRWGGP